MERRTSVSILFNAYRYFTVYFGMALLLTSNEILTLPWEGWTSDTCSSPSGGSLLCWQPEQLILTFSERKVDAAGESPFFYSSPRATATSSKPSTMITA